MKAERHQISNQITEGVIWKQLLFFFFPILFGTFFQQLYNTTDAVIVGKFVGKEALAAVGGPASTLINLLIGFFTGLSSGATVILAQYYGEADGAYGNGALRRGRGCDHGAWDALLGCGAPRDEHA